MSDGHTAGTALMTMEDRVKERLKEIVAELIPEDRWDQIVQTTVEQFEKYDLPKLVKKNLEDWFNARMREELAKPEWQAKWTNTGGQVASDAVKKLLEEAAPNLLAAMIGSVSQHVVQNFANQFRSPGVY